MDIVKRILILMAFGAAFAVFLLVVMKARAATETARLPSRPVPAKPVAESKPSPVRPEDTEARTVERKPVQEAPPQPKRTESDVGLRHLFDSRKTDAGGEVEWSEVADLLREHVERNHPRLKMSDEDYERLADSIKSFREANENMRSMERTSANAAAIGQSLEDLAAAMSEFDQLTGMSPGEFLMEEDSPVSFGREMPTTEPDDEIVTEYLRDHKP